MISVIIPAYNAEATIEGCLDSIICQTYSDLEVIVVDAGSRDQTVSLVQKYALNDKRVHFICTNNNYDLLETRIQGVNRAKGEYIAFVDSRDSISVDYLRLLHRRAVETEADFVISNLVLRGEDGSLSYYNLDPFRNEQIVLEREEVLDAFMRQKDLFYGWHVLWNKLYKTDLWRRTVEIYKQDIKEAAGLSDSEDMVFSSLIWGNAKKVVNVQNAEYLRCQKEGMEESSEEDFFYQLVTPVSDRRNYLEDMKRAISDPDVSVVSFDVFDSCVVRPFWHPTDLFRFLNEDFMRISGASTVIDFAAMRIKSEIAARKRNSHKEDIRIEDIYESLGQDYLLSEKLCNEMMGREIATEIRLSRQRLLVKELYELAVDCGKKVIFVSDMYLSSKVIGEILKKNGYDTREGLYVSSETGVSKGSGRMYEYLMSELNLKGAEWVHIGDNYESDCQQAWDRGIRAFHIPKTIDMFGNFSGNYSGEFLDKVIEHPNGYRDNRQATYGYLGFRTLMAVAFNKVFDNPFVSYAKDSDFNGSPVHLGYFVVGLYLFAVTRWLADEVKDKEIHRVQFLARDGYLVKKVYELFQECMTLPPSNYLYVSRRALALAQVNSRVDMLGLMECCNIFNMSPHKFLQQFQGILSEDIQEDFLDHISEQGYDRDVLFDTQETYDHFLKMFVQECWDEVDWESYRKLLRGYLGAEVSKGDVIFDIGYSGRVESVIKNILGYQIDSYYIHCNSDMICRREKFAGFRNHSLLGYKPSVTGIMREQVFMQTSPSTIGYGVEAGRVVPVFEQEKMDYESKYITELIQQYAVAFCEDVIEIFGTDLHRLYFKYEDLMQPFEYYLHQGKLFDRKVFSSLIFEDGFGMGEKVKAIDYWTDEMEKYKVVAKEEVSQPKEIECQNNEAYKRYLNEGIIGKSTFQKALYWMKKDKIFFIKRLFQYLSGNRYNYLDEAGAEDGQDNG